MSRSRSSHEGRTTITTEQLDQLMTKASTTLNFSVQLMLYFFSNYELTRDNVNVNGVGSRGSHEQKVSLEPTRLALIRRHYFDKVPYPESEQNRHWKLKVVPALSKKICELKKRRRHN